jgi:hypothetical protein
MNSKLQKKTVQNVLKYLVFACTPSTMCFPTGFCRKIFNAYEVTIPYSTDEVRVLCCDNCCDHSPLVQNSCSIRYGT